jgi:multidrug efflux pump subunit AcrA (membrane-fusion protein)
MLPGMSVHAEVKLDAGRRGIVVPRDAVLRYADGRAVVWVAETVNGEDRAAERLVQTGLSFDGLVEITGGISAGERVVIAGNEALRGGQPLAASAPKGN